MEFTEHISNNLDCETEAQATAKQPVMVSIEDQRFLAKICHKIGEAKSRLTGMRKMQKEGITFNSIENFLSKNAAMRKGNLSQGRDEKEVIKLLMENKIRNERENIRRLRKQL